jgi:hypothetical protein
MEDFGLVDGLSPWWDAVERCVEEVGDLIGVFEARHVNGDCGENSEDSIEKNPATESSVLKTCVGKIGCLFESSEAFNHRAIYS